MKYKYYWLKEQLNKVDNRIKIILLFLEFFVKSRYGRDLLITDLIRTQIQQDYIYRDNLRYKRRPWFSVHQYGRGADIRCFDWEPAEVDEVLDLLNSIPYGKGKYQTAVHHRIEGGGIHIHIQVKANA